MPNQNLAYDQRVLCIALRKMTKDTTLIRSGFLHWSKVLSDKAFNIDSVVGELVSYLGLSISDKKTLILTLHTATNRSFNELPPVPEMLLNMIEQPANMHISASQNELSSAQQSEKVVIAKSPHRIITENFLQHLTLRLNKYDSEDLAELKTILIDEQITNVNQELNKTIEQWAVNGFSQINLPDYISETDCYEVTHGIYMLMSEVVGPVESDRIIDHAINETLKLDAATRFSPRNLL